MLLFFRAIRQRRQWRQRDVAAVLGRSGSWVSRIESGEASLTLRQLVRLARLFGVHPWDLVSFQHFVPPTRWPAPLCADCQARCTTAMDALSSIDKGVLDRQNTP
jgi:transcriptional regulator with XRE-family HTH domain